ncbi:MAG: hypothetical protein NC092_03815 [Butyrivibrio sp.]|nr:hypothetical protein [Butyrivibrio sp.]
MASSQRPADSLRRMVRKTIGNLLYYLPRKTARSIWFAVQHGYRMDFRNPRTLDEKLNWLLVYAIGAESAVYADKIGVREFVAQKGLESLLPEIYGVWSHTSEIVPDELPEQFVLKCNHASGELYYEIVRDKSAVDWPSVLGRLEKMLHTNYAKTHCEYQYGYITPCVYAEEFLDDGREDRMTDYKIYCFYGKPHCIMTCTDRSTSMKRLFFDPDWNYLDYEEGASSQDALVERPQGLPVMLEAAAVLSESFPFARVDFYDVAGKVYFGEITLTPTNCNIRHLNAEGQRILGELLDLESVKKKKEK